MKSNTLTYIIVVTTLALITAYALYNRGKSCPCCHGDSHAAHNASATQTTFAMIKPEAVAAGKAQDIIKIIKDHGFTIVTQSSEILISKEDAEKFYGVHKDRPFYNDLVAYITSGPVVMLALQKENAVQEWRDLMGATDPLKAKEGTIRNLFGTDIQHNAVHGSDSVENAQKELELFIDEKLSPKTQAQTSQE
jgi:nucleoside-diphosphate kinase